MRYILVLGPVLGPVYTVRDYDDIVGVEEHEGDRWCDYNLLGARSSPVVHLLCHQPHQIPARERMASMANVGSMESMHPLVFPKLQDQCPPSPAARVRGSLWCLFVTVLGKTPEKGCIHES